MRRFKSGRLEPTLLVAEQQSAGRGRLGRQWHSQRGDSLMFSLGLPLAPADWSGLSLAVGISTAESLDATNLPDRRIGLKWPNDLWLTDKKTERKLGGILVETATFESQRYVVIGVGINVRAVDFAAQQGTAAAIAPGCLQDLQPQADVASALLQVLPPLVQTVQAFERFGFAPFQARFNQRDVLAGRNVQVSDGTISKVNSQVQGQAHGVTETGALLVHTSAGMKEITSSEVTVRPILGRAPSFDMRPC